MQKQIRVVDKERGRVQITTADERWYARPIEDPNTKLPTYEFVPSVTWIADHYPKGMGFYKWLASKGWDEAEAIKVAAGDKGSKVHMAVNDLLLGTEIKMDAVYINPTTNIPEPLTLEEYECLQAFQAWYLEVRPEIVARDLVVWNLEHHYAGTVDFLFVKNQVLWLPDLKTSQSIWPSHQLQVSAYAHTPEVAQIQQALKLDTLKLAILQVGYRYNQKQFKFTEVKDQFPLFLAAKQIWAKETAGQKPLQRDYPVSLRLPLPVAPAAQEGDTE